MSRPSISATRCAARARWAGPASTARSRTRSRSSSISTAWPSRLRSSARSTARCAAATATWARTPTGRGSSPRCAPSWTRRGGRSRCSGPAAPPGRSPSRPRWPAPRRSRSSTATGRVAPSSSRCFASARPHRPSSCLGGRLPRAGEDRDIVVNATSIGLFPDVDARLDLDVDSLGPGIVVADVIPNPPRTRLIRDARRAAATVLDGLGMLVNQGVDQHPPLDRGRRRSRGHAAHAWPSCSASRAQVSRARPGAGCHHLDLASLRRSRRRQLRAGSIGRSSQTITELERQVRAPTRASWAARRPARGARSARRGTAAACPPPCARTRRARGTASGRRPSRSGDAGHEVGERALDERRVAHELEARLRAAPAPARPAKRSDSGGLGSASTLTP